MLFVTGVARSGTSLTTGVLGACGAKLGRVNRLNEIGAVRDGVIKPYLSSLGVDPLGQYPLADPDNLAPYPNFRQKVLAAMRGADTYKCCKIGPIWPLWKEHFPDARILIVRRSREGIVDSCHRTGFMRHHPDWGEYVDTIVSHLERMKSEFDCFEVWTDECVRDYRNYRPMIEWAGLEWNGDAVRDMINPGRWHG